MSVKKSIFTTKAKFAHSGKPRFTRRKIIHSQAKKEIFLKFVLPIFIALILFDFSYSQALKNFLDDLAGTTWVVGEGENYKIYQSAARFRPRKVAKIEITNTGAFIQYANLDTSYYYSTAEAIRGVIKQFYFNRDAGSETACPVVEDKSLKTYYTENGKIFVPKDDINKKYSALHIEYKPYNDTTWTLHKVAQDSLSSNKYESAYIRFGPNEATYTLNDLTDELLNKTYTESKPLMILYRKFDNGKDGKIFDTQNGTMEIEVVKIDGKKDEYDTIGRIIYAKKNVDLFSVTGYEPYAFEGCNISTGKGDGKFMVAEYVLATSANQKHFKTDTLGFWRVHITPEVWWSPRNADGKIDHDSLETHANAMRWRQEYLDDKKKNVNLESWLDPTLNDTMSVILSFSFVMPANPTSDIKIYLDQQDKIKELKLDANKNNMYYAHIPKRMYKVGAGEEKLQTKRALVQLFARDTAEEKQARELYDLCIESTWESTDIDNSYIIFPIDTIVKDTIIKLRKDTSITERDTIIKDVVIRKRAKNVDDGVFMYDGCPCTREEKLDNLTKFEVRKYIYKQIPAHSLNTLNDAITFWKILQKILTNKDDKDILADKIKKAGEVSDKLDKMYKDNNIDPDKVKTRKSWVDDVSVREIIKRNSL